VSFNHRHDRNIDLGPAVDDFCAQVRVHARPRVLTRSPARFHSTIYFSGTVGSVGYRPSLPSASERLCQHQRAHHSSTAGL
jgi:hypothetical protein